MRYCDFPIFQDGSRLPSLISMERIWTTRQWRQGYLAVFITVQNLAVIDAVILIISKFEYLARLP